MPLTINFQPGHQQTVLTLDQVTLSLPGRQLFKPLSLELHRHEQVALVGPNGAGKSSLIKSILGSFPGTVSGQITQPAQVISTVRQNYQAHGSLRQLASQDSLAYSDLLNMLRKLGMPRESFDVPVEHMSMGQQKKVELSRSLLTPAQLYIWDEPLNYLDTYNQQQLIDLIKQFRPTLLFVEHDQHFIDAVASRVITVAPD